ncbi:hypothetical protein CAPN008_12090 [Capnocytophaga canis]|nr:hypothetical protein CAPN008_12090 [Capnocytophaga canis]
MPGVIRVVLLKYSSKQLFIYSIFITSENVEPKSLGSGIFNISIKRIIKRRYVLILISEVST